MNNENIVRVLKLSKKSDGNFGSLLPATELPSVNMTNKSWHFWVELNWTWTFNKILIDFSKFWVFGGFWKFLEVLGILWPPTDSTRGNSLHGYQLRREIHHDGVFEYPHLSLVTQRYFGRFFSADSIKISTTECSYRLPVGHIERQRRHPQLLQNISMWSIRRGFRYNLPSYLSPRRVFFLTVFSSVVPGFTPDVKIWEVNFKKDTGDFQSVDRALELTGHSAGIPAFAFSGDSTHVVSVSKDKTFRLYDIIVEYKKKQDARLIHSAPWTQEDVDVASTQVALSNDSRCVVIATKGDILILSGVDGSLKTLIQSPIPGTIPSEKFQILK